MFTNVVFYQCEHKKMIERSGWSSIDISLACSYLAIIRRE